MSKSNNLDRRGFLKLALISGTALGVGWQWVDQINQGSISLVMASTGDQYQYDLFLKIDRNGILTVVNKMVEMGQGISTGLAMWAAEELDQPWEMVEMELADGDQAYGDQRTSGSASMRNAHRTYRQSGAYLRETFKLLAADEWGISAGTCTTSNGAVHHPDGVQQLTYGQLVVFVLDEGRLDNITPPSGAAWKSPADFNIIGTPARVIHKSDIVAGKTLYGNDIRLPGMLYASLSQPPVRGAVINSYDDSAARAVPGVVDVIQTAYGVAVLAENTWAAFRGKEALSINWSAGNFSAVYTSQTEREMGARSAAQLSGDPNMLESVYRMNYLAHMTMSPMNCTADYRGDSCEVWAPCQYPDQARQAAAQESGLAYEAVTAHIPFLGGGFGRRIETDYVRQAVAISKAASAPVQLAWTRDDDLHHDYFHPMSHYIARTDLTNPQMPELVYISMPAALASKPVGAWRAAGNLTPAFVQQCFIDEMAEALGRDPVELRLEIEDSKMYPVINLAASQAGWGSSIPAGWGRGFACFNTNDTPAAIVVDLSVDAEGVVQVQKVVCAVSPGIVVNPDLVKAQIEGGIIFGLSAVLKGKVTIAAGQVEQSNYVDHPIIRFSEAPEIEVYPINSWDAVTGVGEMGVSPILPATINALYNATGRRIRHIPVSKNDLVPKHLAGGG